MVVAVAMAVAHVVSSGAREAVPTIGLATLACTFGIVAYWFPCVRVGDETVEVVNVLTTTTVPLARIVHVDTRWAMEVFLDDGRTVSAFVAPAPGVHGARDIRSGELRGLPADTYVNRTVRVGDRLGTASGDAALLVRTALTAWRESEHTDNQPVAQHLNVVSLVALACSLLAAVTGFVV